MTCYVKDVEDMGLKFPTSNIPHRACAELFCNRSMLNAEHFRHQGLGDGLAATGSGDDFLEGDDVVGFEDVGDEVEFLFGFGFAEVADVPGEDGDGGLGEGDD
jgi:hypothetical protein